jgi:hypothetical protein
MRSFREHLEESEYSNANPVPGDHFDIELGVMDAIIESVVTELTDDGSVIVEADDAAIALMQQYGMIVENSNMPVSKDSTSVLAGIGDQIEDNEEGRLSPIFGGAFKGYDIHEDPRKWLTKDKSIKEDLNEAEYHGRNVPLGKKMKGDVKKSKVYVRKPNGNIVKVNFGDKTMRIKKSNPKRRKSFRARHHCENPGPRWKARYWSCRSW